MPLSPSPHHSRPTLPPVVTTEVLPFRIDIASDADLKEVVALRIAAYGRREGVENLPLGIRALDEFDQPARILTVRDKLTNELVGSVRWHMPHLQNAPVHDCVFRALAMSERWIYLDRFAVLPHSGQAQVGTMLVKAVWLLAGEMNVQEVGLVSLRALTRFYNTMGLAIAPGASEGVALESFGGRVYYPMKVNAPGWHKALHERRPLLAKQVFSTHHPDILAERRNRPVSAHSSVTSIRGT